MIGVDTRRRLLLGLTASKSAEVNSHSRHRRSCGSNPLDTEPVGHRYRRQRNTPIRQEGLAMARAGQLLAAPAMQEEVSSLELQALDQVPCLSFPRTASLTTFSSG